MPSEQSSGGVRRCPLCRSNTAVPINALPTHLVETHSPADIHTSRGFFTPDAMRTANEDAGAAHECENRRPGRIQLPEQILATMFTNEPNPDKFSVVQPPASLLESCARAERGRIADLVGFTQIAGRRRGGVGPQHWISEPIRRERRCIGWFQQGRIDKALPRSSSLSADSLLGFGGVGL